MKLLERVSILVRKADYDAKIKNVEDKNPDHVKYITTIYSGKFSGAMFDKRLNKAELPKDMYIANVEKHAIWRKMKKLKKKYKN